MFVVYVRRDGGREYRYVSPGVRDIYGLEPEDLMRDPTLVARYRHPDDLQLLEDLAETMKFGSLCALGGFTPYPVMSALRHFPQDVAPIPRVEAAE